MCFNIGRLRLCLMIQLFRMLSSERTYHTQRICLATAPHQSYTSQTTTELEDGQGQGNEGLRHMSERLLQVVLFCGVWFHRPNKTCQRSPCLKVLKVQLSLGQANTWSAHRRLRRPRTERYQRVAIFKKLLDRCKKVKICPHCGETNGTVKYAPSPF